MNTLEYVHEGLSATPKHLHQGFINNKRTGVLFDNVCKHPDYYVYRSDIQVLKDCSKEVADHVGKNVQLVEIGCGLCHKSFPLLETLEDLESFVAFDIDDEVLNMAKAELTEKFPNVKVLPLVADIFATPTLPECSGSRVGLLAGTLTGAYQDDNAKKLVKCSLDCLGENAVLLASFDTNQDTATNKKPYLTDDYSALVLNALHTLNTEFGADFNIDEFFYKCHWNAEEKQIEHRVVAKSPQTVKVDGKEYTFEKDEEMMVFPVRKRKPEEFEKLVNEVGAVVKKVFFESENRTCCVWMEKA